MSTITETLLAPLTIATAPEASRPMLEKVKKSIGFIPNLMAIFANNPTVLEGYLALGAVFEKGSFTPMGRQIILLAASLDSKEQLQLLRCCTFTNSEEPPPHALVQVRCRCKVGRGISLIVVDQGQGFDPHTVADSVTVENLEADHGRAIHLMKLAMDEVSLEQGGTEVHMCKRPPRNPRADVQSDSGRS